MEEFKFGDLISLPSGVNCFLINKNKVLHEHTLNDKNTFPVVIFDGDVINCLESKREFENAENLAIKLIENVEMFSVYYVSLRHCSMADFKDSSNPFVRFSICRQLKLIDNNEDN